MPQRRAVSRLATADMLWALPRVALISAVAYSIRWVWQSAMPGISTMPAPSTTVPADSSAGGSPAATAVMAPFFAVSQPPEITRLPSRGHISAL